MTRHRGTSLLLNIGHALDPMFLLIFATAVTSIALEFGFTRWEDLMPYSSGAFLMFGIGSVPAGRLGDLWGRRCEALELGHRRQAVVRTAHLTRPATISELRERYGARYRWLLLLAVMVGSVAGIMSATIINVGVPDMSHHFVIGQDRAQWVASGFMVAMTVFMLTTPWLLGRHGYRRTAVGTRVLRG